MKSKIKPKSSTYILINNNDKSKSLKNDNKPKEKYLSKNKNRTLLKNSRAKKISKLKEQNNLKQKINNINIEDSSTNCFSGINKKNLIPKIEYNIINNKKKDNFIIPLLIPRESDTESLFINFKLGEKDSYTESTLRSNVNKRNEYKNIDNLKLNKNMIKNYDHCDVDKNIGKNENDSLEIYDFTDKTNVNYVLKNLSALSCSKSGKDKSSFNLDDLNEDELSGNKKIINKIKVFNTKQSISNNYTRIKLNKDKGTFIKNNILFRPNNKY